MLHCGDVFEAPSDFNQGEASDRQYSNSNRFDIRDIMSDGLNEGDIDRTMSIKALGMGKSTLHLPVVRCENK